MRLAFLANGYAGAGHHGSGVGNYLARLVPLLAARGHECVVICNAADASPTAGRSRRTRG